MLKSLCVLAALRLHLCLGIPIKVMFHLWPLLCPHISLAKEWESKERLRLLKTTERRELWGEVWGRESRKIGQVFGWKVGKNYCGAYVYFCMGVYLNVWLESDETRPAWWKVRPTAKTNTRRAEWKEVRTRGRGVITMEECFVSGLHRLSLGCWYWPALTEVGICLH